MNIFLIFVLSLCWLFIAYLLFKKNSKEGLAKVYTVVLAYRLLFLIAQIGIFYIVYKNKTDSFLYINYLRAICSGLIDYPEELVHLFLGNYENMHMDVSMQYNLTTEPRVAFFVKVLLPFFLVSGGNYLLCCLWLTLFGTYCLMQFYTMERDRVGAGVWILVFLVPSFSFWTVGILKESFVIPVFFLLFYFYRKAESRGFWDVLSILLFILFFLLVWYIKYYYAVLFLMLCAGYIYFKYVTISLYSWLALIAFGFMFLLGIGITHPNLQLADLATLLYESNVAVCQLDPMAECIYFSLDGSWLSVLKNIPRAILYSAYTPAWNQIHNAPTVFAAIESYALIGLFFYMIVKWITKHIQLDKKEITALLFILCIGVLLVLSTPNSGTFSRYRIIYMPLFCYILFKHTIPHKWLYGIGLK